MVHESIPVISKLDNNGNIVIDDQKIDGNIEILIDNSDNVLVIGDDYLVKLDGNGNKIGRKKLFLGWDTSSYDYNTDFH